MKKPAPELADTGPAVKPGRPVDLLPLIDPDRDAVRGKWRKKNGALVSDRGQPTIITIPYKPPDEYRITMVAERTDGDNAINFGLVADGRSFSAGLDNFSERGGITGFETLDGKRLDEMSLSHKGMALVNNRPSTIVFTVAKHHFSIAHDNATLVDWPDADYRRCGLNFHEGRIDHGKLFLSTWNSVYRISRLELTPLVAAARPGVRVAKLAVPTEAAQAKAAKTVHDAYSDQIRQATSAEQRLALAKKLRDDGLATADDPVGKFVMLAMARDGAAANGDLDTALDCIDKLSEQFAIDALTMKSDLLHVVARSAHRPDDLSDKLNAFADEAAAADRYDLAKRALAAAIVLRGEPKRAQADGDSSKGNRRDGSRVPQAQGIARAALAANPADPEANLAVGKFECLAKGDFAAGLPLLAKGSDKRLADLAQRDLAAPAGSAEQLKIADGWWETGKQPARLRAKAIYEKALPELSGIARVKIEKRLQEFETKAAVETWTNLLPLVDTDKNAIRGKWKNGSDGLECTDSGFGNSIMIPQDPGANYQIRTEFTRLTGTMEIMVLLPANGSHCRLLLGASGRFGGGIDMIAGHDIQSNNPTARFGRLENKRRYRLEITVRHNGKGIEIVARVDGKDFTSYRGPAAELTGLPFGIHLPNAKWLALGVQNSTAIFHSLEYRKLPVGGR